MPFVVGTWFLTYKSKSLEICIVLGKKTVCPHQPHAVTGQNPYKYRDSIQFYLYCSILRHLKGLHPYLWVRVHKQPHI